jgi:hypothetical protein
LIYVNIMKSVILFLIAIPIYLLAQIEIDLPSEVMIHINDTTMNLTAGWVDSLLAEAEHGKIRYNIVQAYGNGQQVNTSLKLPQILSLTEITRQIVFYYSLLNSEMEREKESLAIYPYFSSIQQRAFISCSYRSAGNYYFRVRNWQTVSIPPPPKPEDKYIFNQILNETFGKIQHFGSIPDEIFSTIALRNRLSVHEVRTIYEKTILWQLSN